MCRGFTLAEVIIVIGIIAMSAGLLLFASNDQLRVGSFRADRDALVVLLQHARSQAMANVCMGAFCTRGVAHGVKILPHQFVLFQGDAYATREEQYDVATSYDRVVVSDDDEVVFEILSGNPSTSATITINDVQSQRTSVISIGDEGQISWTQ